MKYKCPECGSVAEFSIYRDMVSGVTGDGAVLFGPEPLSVEAEMCCQACGYVSSERDFEREDK